MHGLKHTSRLDEVHKELHANAKQTVTHQEQEEDPTIQLNMCLSGAPDSALATLVNNDARDPKNWKEAMRSRDKDKWKKGMRKELDSIQKRGVWKLVPPAMVPHGRKIIGCRQVCHIKRDASGQEAEHKV